MFEVKASCKLLCLISSRTRLCRSGFTRDAMAECMPRSFPSELMVNTLCVVDSRQLAAHVRRRGRGNFWPIGVCREGQRKQGLCQL